MAMVFKQTAIYALLLLNCFLIACGKDDNKPSDKSSNKVSATIQLPNTAPFTFTVSGEAVKINPIYPGASEYHINAQDSANRTLFMHIPIVTAPGTYPITASSVVVGNGEGSLSYNNDLNGTGLSNSFTTIYPSATAKGSVTITVINTKRIEGTFTARAKNSLGEEAVITNGSFIGNL